MRNYLNFKFSPRTNVNNNVIFRGIYNNLRFVKIVQIIFLRCKNRIIVVNLRKMYVLSMADVNYINENVAMPDIHFQLVNRWVSEVAASFDKGIGHLTYIFCSDERILEVNKQFLNHDYYTDIITFDNSRRGIITGDMYISIETVSSNANLLHKSYEEELHRVIIHGVLHLCGINDKGPGEREIMEFNEDKALNLLNKLKNEI